MSVKSLSCGGSLQLSEPKRRDRAQISLDKSPTPELEVTILIRKGQLDVNGSISN